MLCRKCGRPGHAAAVCRSPGNRCFNGGEMDHIIKDCPHQMGANLRECFECRETGHFAKDCPKRAETNDGAFYQGASRYGRGRGGGGFGSRGAFRGGRGGFHGERDYPRSEYNDTSNEGEDARGERDSFRGGGLDDMTTVICNNCDLPNHTAKGCTKPKVKCHVCYGVGHMARFCFYRVDENNSVSNYSSRECYACGKVGNLAANPPPESR